CSLADGDGNRFACIPFAMEDPLNPFFAGNQAAFFRRKVDAGFLPHTKMRCVVRNAVNTEALANVVKEDIAGLLDRTLKVDRTVGARPLMRPIDPTFELAAIEGAVARAEGRETRRGILVFEHGRSHDDFEDRARSQLALDSAIE